MSLFENLRGLLSLPQKQKILCMVVSEQEDSEIWINGRRTHYRTPRLVALPKNKDVFLEVKQWGHETHQAWLRTSHDLSFHYCDLKRIPLRLVNENSKIDFALPDRP